MSIENITCQVGAQEMKFETGKMGKLADGAVTVQVGDTIVMVTAVSQTKVREGQDWFPLSVEYKERQLLQDGFPEDTSREKAGLLRRRFSPAG